jgi:hypothetical protein
MILAFRRMDVYELARRLLGVLFLYDQAGWKNVVILA